jgi:CHAT domain-containing protein
MTAPTTMSNCPTEETLAAFVDGRLDADARERVIAHLADCAECRDVVLTASEFSELEQTELSATRQHLDRTSWSKRPRSFAVPLAIAASLLVAVSAVLLWWSSSRSADSMSELLQAGNALEQRSLEGRLSDGFAYRPLEPILRSGETEETDLAIQIAVRRAQDAAKISPSTERLHAAAIGQLLLAKPDRAVQMLESLLNAETKESDVAKALNKSRDVRLLNSLSVAYLAQQRASRNPRAALLASEAAQRSWLIEQTPEAAWNRAVAIEKLYLWKAAAAAWGDYLRLDPDSEWAVEARSRLKRVNAQTLSQGWERGKATAWDAARRLDLSSVQAIARLYPEQMRLAAEDEILVALASAIQAAGPGRSVITGQAETIARASANLGDSTLSDLVRMAHDPTQGQSFAGSFLGFIDARKHYRESRISEAVESLRRSSAQADAAGLPLSAMHALLAAGCAYYQNDYVAALETISGISAELDCNRWPSLCGRAAWLAGISQISNGQMNEALRSYEAARQHYQRIGYKDGELAATGLLASGLELVGDLESAWGLRLRALQMVAEIGSASTRLPQTLAGAAAASQRDGFIETSILFCDAVLEATEEPTWADVRHAALSRRSELYRRRGDSAAGRRDLASAGIVATSIKDRDVQGFATTHPDHLRARLEDMPSSEERSALLDGAFAFAKSTGNVSREIEVLLLRGAEDARRGDASAAEKTLEAALGLIDAQRSRLDNLQLREAYLDQRRDVYRKLAASVAVRGNVERSLHFAERARARTLREQYEGSVRASAPSIDDLRAQLPEEFAVLYFMHTGNLLGQWLVTRDGIQYHGATIPPSQVESLANEMLAKEPARAAKSARMLARVLLEPFAAQLRSARTIVFVPDDGLAGVAFAALPIDGHLLLEGSRVFVAPSLALLVSCKKRSEHPVNTPSLLAVSPLTGGAEGSDYLPDAVAESEDVVRHFNGISHLLSGARATKSAIRSAATRSHILHFSGHGIFDRSHPSYAAIQVSDSRDGSMWYAHEIANTRLENVRLVVLASCEGLRPATRHREGVSSLGRAFIAAGVPAVIGAIRPVDDEVARALFARFYGELARGADAATALREAQLSLRDRYPIRSWAIFQLLGGVA